ncbi:MAG: acyl-CoA thioesterase [Solirubrobacteraceae bacterium]
MDEYGHLNMAHHLTICDEANWAFWNWLNAPEQTLEERDGHEYVIVENHVVYGAELVDGALFAIETQLTDLDDKRWAGLSSPARGHRAGQAVETRPIPASQLDM